MTHVRFHASVCIALALSGLAACSTPAPQPVQAPVLAAKTLHITAFGQTEVDEAASAYVAAYERSVTSSLKAGRYIESLAFLHLNAESCLDSRASRLLDRELQPKEKTELLLRAVSAEQMRAYEGLSTGFNTRVNGLEMLACDQAGLKVASTLKY